MTAKQTMVTSIIFNSVLLQISLVQFNNAIAVDVFRLLYQFFNVLHWITHYFINCVLFHLSFVLKKSGVECT